MKLNEPGRQALKEAEFLAVGKASKRNVLTKSGLKGEKT